MAAEFTFDPSSGRYRYARGGRLVPPARVEAAVHAVTDAMMGRVEALTDRLIAGEVAVNDWHAAMRREIKDAHGMAGMIGAGGRKAAGPADWSRVGVAVRAQYGWLEQFARDIEAGRQPLDGTLRSRAAMYADAATGTFEATRAGKMAAAGFTEMRRHLHSGAPCEDCVAYAARGWAPIGGLPLPTQECRCVSRCRCSVEYRGRGRTEPVAKPRPKPTPKPRPVKPPPPPPKPRPERPAPEPPKPRPPKPVEPATPPNRDTRLPGYRRHVKYVRTEVHAAELPGLAAEVGAPDGDAYRREMGRRMQEAVDAGAFYVRAAPETIGRILDGGRFRSQFETGTSGGGLDPDARRFVEEAALAVAPKLAAADRPIYGHVSPPDFGTFGQPGQDNLAAYGSASVRLKDSVRARATVTFGDSLAQFDAFAGTPAKGVSLDAAPLDRPRWRNVHRTLYDATIPAADRLAAAEANLSYVEAQFHGQLTADDIAEVAFAEPPPPDVAAALNSRGIPWRVR